MTRQGQIKQAAKEYADDSTDKVQSIIAQVGFEMGAEWADSHPHWISVEDELPASPKEETKWTEHTLQRDKDGFLVGEVSDLDVYLPFEVHDNKHDTWEVIEDDSALVDWSGDIDTKPRYDRIRTIRQVISKSKNIGKDLKGGEV